VYFLVGPPPISFSVLPMIFLSVILGLLLNFCMTASIALLSFWVEDNEPFFWIYNKFQLILGGVLIPLDFFPDWLSSVALQLPFMQIFYGPARLFVSFSGERALQLILGQSIWLVLAFLTLRTLFFFGVRQVNTNGG
jgi:ABC-2 type transport system permease protein